VRVAQKLLGAPTIGGESARPRGGSGGSQRSQRSLPSRPKCKKRQKNGRFPALTELKIAKNAVFYFKALYKIYSQDLLEEYINFKNFCYLRRCGVIPVQSFGSHIHSQPSGFELKCYSSLKF
jgi:hypothetical protein